MRLCGAPPAPASAPPRPQARDCTRAEVAARLRRKRPGNGACSATHVHGHRSRWWQHFAIRTGRGLRPPRRRSPRPGPGGRSARERRRSRSRHRTNGGASRRSTCVRPRGTRGRHHPGPAARRAVHAEEAQAEGLGKTRCRAAAPAASRVFRSGRRALRFGYRIEIASRRVIFAGCAKQLPHPRRVCARVARVVPLPFSASPHPSPGADKGWNGACSRSPAPHHGDRGDHEQRVHSNQAHSTIDTTARRGQIVASSSADAMAHPAAVGAGIAAAGCLRRRGRRRHHGRSACTGPGPGSCSRSRSRPGPGARARTCSCSGTRATAGAVKTPLTGQQIGTKVSTWTDADTPTAARGADRGRGLRTNEAYHIHAHLAIFPNGAQFAVPSHIGSRQPACNYDTTRTTGRASSTSNPQSRRPARTRSASCSPCGVGAQRRRKWLESPIPRSSPISTTTERSQQWTGNIADIELMPHREITIQIGTPPERLPTYDWSMVDPTRFNSAPRPGRALAATSTPPSVHHLETRLRSAYHKNHTSARRTDRARTDLPLRARSGRPACRSHAADVGAGRDHGRGLRRRRRQTRPRPAPCTCTCACACACACASTGTGTGTLHRHLRRRLLPRRRPLPRHPCRRSPRRRRPRRQQLGVSTWAERATPDGGQGQPIDGLSCVTTVNFHKHAHLSIFKDGVQTGDPACRRRSGCNYPTAHARLPGRGPHRAPTWSSVHARSVLLGVGPHADERPGRRIPRSGEPSSSTSTTVGVPAGRAPDYEATSARSSSRPAARSRSRSARRSPELQTYDWSNDRVARAGRLSSACESPVGPADLARRSPSAFRGRAPSARARATLTAGPRSKAGPVLYWHAVPPSRPGSIAMGVKLKVSGWMRPRCGRRCADDDAVAGDRAQLAGALAARGTAAARRGLRHGQERLRRAGRREEAASPTRSAAWWPALDPHSPVLRQEDVQGIPRGHDRQLRRRRHRDRHGRRPGQGRLADRRLARLPRRPEERRPDHQDRRHAGQGPDDGPGRQAHARRAEHQGRC